MKLRIVFYNQNIFWNKNWIFLGSSFSSLKVAEENISGPRIKISKFLKESYKKELKNYLEWIERQRIANNDSIFWWMSKIGSRNNADSNFFLYICQINLLKKILDNYKYKNNNEELLVVCDDVLFINSLLKNFKDYNIKANKQLKLKMIKNFLFHYFKIFKNSFIAIIDILISQFCAKLTLNNKNLPDGEIYLLHQYLGVDSLRSDKDLESRYFPHIKKYFGNENIKLFCLSWFGHFWLGKIKAFKKLRKENHLIPEDWINIKDYIVSIINFYKTSACFTNISKYSDIDISDLILHEKRLYLEKIISTLRFWTYMPAIKKWSKNCNSITCIDHYENMIFEHSLIASVRNLDKKIKICGYHHTLASKEFAPWQSLHSEWKSKFKPDCVISLGLVSSKMLFDQGVPKERIIDGPALRYNSLLIEEERNTRNKNNIAITLPPDKESAFELLSKVKILCCELENENYRFIIQPHPNLNLPKITSLLKLKELPKNLSISNEKIHELLRKCFFNISMSTGAVYDAVLCGNIVFNLESELELANNYLDIFDDNFPLVSPLSIESIKNILLRFRQDNKNIEDYIEEFHRLRNYLIKNMNVVNDLHLSKFKLN